MTRTTGGKQRGKTLTLDKHRSRAELPAGAFCAGVHRAVLQQLRSGLLLPSSLLKALAVHGTSEEELLPLQTATGTFYFPLSYKLQLGA